jgi:hypothetical protein
MNLYNKNFLKDFDRYPFDVVGFTKDKTSKSIVIFRVEDRLLVRLASPKENR